MTIKSLISQVFKDILAWSWFLAFVEVFIFYLVFRHDDGLANIDNNLHYAEINAGRIGGNPSGTYIGSSLPDYQQQLFALKLQIYLSAIALDLIISFSFLLVFGLILYFYHLKNLRYET